MGRGVLGMKLSFEEFKKQWYERLPKESQSVQPDLPEHVLNDLREYFCECDYKRYTGEWDTQEL